MSDFDDLSDEFPERLSTSRINFKRGKTRAMSRRTECRKGHPLTPENTYTRERREGGIMRECIICKNARARKWTNKNRDTFAFRVVNILNEWLKTCDAPEDLIVRTEALIESTNLEIDHD